MSSNSSVKSKKALPQQSLRIIIGSLCVGGAERHLSYILPELNKKGWSIRVLTLTELTEGDLSQYLISQGISVNAFPTFRLFGYLPLLFRRSLKLLINMLRLSADFVKDRESITHFFLPRAYILGAVAARLTFVKQPLVMSRRSLSLYQQSKPVSRWFERQLHRFNDMNLGNSLAIIKQLHFDEDIPLDKLSLIYNGVPHPEVVCQSTLAHIQSLLKLAENTYVITMVANLIPYKGHLDLLQALGQIKHQLKQPWILLLVGHDSGIADSLKATARSLGIDGNIHWLGSRKDVNAILTLSHLGILCSHEEGFSNSILEAMAAKLPMIVTDVGGNAEAIIDGVTGLVVPAKAPDKLSQAILWMHKNPQKAQTFSALGYQRFVEHFSLTQCVQAYHDLYNTLLHQAPTKLIGTSISEIVQ